MLRALTSRQNTFAFKSQVISASTMAGANVMAGASEQKQTDLSGGGSLASLARSVPASSTMELLDAKQG